MFLISSSGNATGTSITFDRRKTENREHLSDSNGVKACDDNISYN